MEIILAIAHVADSRTDFFAKREALFEEEVNNLAWLRDQYRTVESDCLRSSKTVKLFAEQVRMAGAQSLIIHLPIWADPILTIKLFNHIRLPILLLGNSRPDTSSIVGLLGAGGALDQVGCQHLRVFDHTKAAGRRTVVAFVRAAATRDNLRGQTLGLFGSRSLGIFTAGADTAQWQQLFGVDIEYVDQLEIVRVGEQVEGDEVARHRQWLAGRVAEVTFGGNFDAGGLERQVRSYIATEKLVRDHGFDFVGVKCQRELSDGYATQCVAHMLMNGTQNVDGLKKPVIHACESDADGALTMQILHLLAEGRPAALLDIRWLDVEKGIWTLANCGALAADFFATAEDPSGFSAIHIGPHVFGEGGGGALPAIVAPQQVTLARLCRKDGRYWMAILKGEVQRMAREVLGRTTAAFPQAFVKSAAGEDFLAEFGSNHIHMVSGDLAEEVIAFCRLLGIPWRIWQ